jgi:superfamily II DNA or RNA helicase
MQIDDQTPNQESPQDRLRSAEEDCERLRKENVRLRKMLGIPELVGGVTTVHSDSDPENSAKSSSPSTPEEKITLFRGLFRGREDIYAVRWEGRGGKSGYSPAGTMDWRAIHSARPGERKRVARKTRMLMPLTPDAIRKHLTGKQTIGIYPLLPNETCWFLAVDFDKKSWMADTAAFLETCRQFQVPAAVERSRSGNGAHVWMFFDRTVLAADARRLGCGLLTRTMERRHEIGLDSYDRLFPSQDTMPKGGFGNLIALPLQRGPREQGNSVFLNELFEPYGDQWKFLESVQRIETDGLAALIHEVAPEGNTLGVHLSLPEGDDGEPPWLWSPSRKRKEAKITDLLPPTVCLITSNLVYIEKKGLPSSMQDRLIRLAAFQNPEFYKAQSMRLSTYGKPRIISCSESFPEHIGLPRGCLQDVLDLFKSHGVKTKIQDERTTGQHFNVSFNAELRDEQHDAVAQLLTHDEGILCAPTAFGKTVIGACLIARRGVSALILVHRRQLMDQWRERLAAFLAVPIDNIGQFGGGKNKRTGTIDVAVIQSLQHKGVVHDFVAEYGHVVVDECHHLSAFTFERVLRQIKAKYVLGMTATPTRKDGHHPIIYMQCGPVRFYLSPKKAAQSSALEHKVILRFTDFAWNRSEDETTIHDIYAALVTDQQRNDLIVQDVRNVLSGGRSPLILTSRTEHLDYLAGRLRGICPHIFVLKGGMGTKQRKQVAESISLVSPDEPRMIMATGSYLGEGFDDARLDTLFLVMPISWKGTLQQYVGRLHRLHENKKDVLVYDYADLLVPMLARMYKRRLAGYSALGYVVAEAPNI